MVDSPDTLPGCFGYFGKPVAPNVCSLCPVKEACRKYVPKELLTLILDKVSEVKIALQGGM